MTIKQLKKIIEKMDDKAIIIVHDIQTKTNRTVIGKIKQKDFLTLITIPDFEE